MQNCVRELNLTYCLIYLNDIIIFLQTAGEHLHCLHVIFDQFRKHNLKLKLSKCNLFRSEITYLAHWVLKDSKQCAVGMDVLLDRSHAFGGGIDVNPWMPVDSRLDNHHNCSQNWNAVARPLGHKMGGHSTMSSFSILHYHLLWHGILLFDPWGTYAANIMVA